MLRSRRKVCKSSFRITRYRKMTIKTDSILWFLVFCGSITAISAIKSNNNRRRIQWLSGTCEWEITEARASFLGPSPRWRNFKETSETHGIRLLNNSLLNFSVRTDDGSVNLDFYSKDFTQSLRINYQFLLEELSSFNDYTYVNMTIAARNGSLELISDKSVSMVNTNQLIPKWIFLDNSWIYHDYTFFSSQKESTNNTEIFLRDSLPEKCVCFLYALNNNSVLELSLHTSKDEINKTLIGTDSLLIEWQSHCLRLDSGLFGTLTINRRLKENATGQGFWALDDVKFCDDVNLRYQPSCHKKKVTKHLVEEYKKQSFEAENEPEASTPEDIFIRSKFVTDLNLVICAPNSTNLTFFIQTDDYSIVKPNDFKYELNKGQILKMNDIDALISDTTNGVWIVSDGENTFAECNDLQQCEKLCEITQTPNPQTKTQYYNEQFVDSSSLVQLSSFNSVYYFMIVIITHKSL